jgi:hypothetical protein
MSIVDCRLLKRRLRLSLNRNIDFDLLTGCDSLDDTLSHLPNTSEVTKEWLVLLTELKICACTPLVAEHSPSNGTRSQLA